MAAVAAALVAAALASAPAERALFLFELKGTPVGTVALALDGSTYTYRSRHLFTRDGVRGTTERRASYALAGDGTFPDGARPESLWLWRRPPPGCFPLRGELTEAAERGCAEEGTGDTVRGTVQGAPFEARYDGGRLVELTLGAARFSKLAAEANLAAPRDLFGDGFPVEGAGGTLALEPPLDAEGVELRPWEAGAARALAEQVHRSFRASGPSDADWRDDGADVGGCLAHARRFVERAEKGGHDARVVLGLVMDAGRAWPHAWVEVALPGGKRLALDPTLMRPVSASEYLTLGPKAGEVYVALLGGGRKLIREPVPAKAREPARPR